MATVDGIAALPHDFPEHRLSLRGLPLHDNPFQAPDSKPYDPLPRIFFGI